MPCKSLKECLQYAMSIGPAKEAPDNILKKIKEHLMNETVEFAKHRKLEDQKLLVELFKYLFKE